MQPRFASSIVPPGTDDFIEDMRVVAVQPGDFLIEPVVRRGHELVVTANPQCVALAQGSGDMATRRLNRVLAQDLGIGGRKLAVPIDGFRSSLAHGALLGGSSPRYGGWRSRGSHRARPLALVSAADGTG